MFENTGTRLKCTQQTKVSLVGAGPGDPELLTLKAAKAIARASVILVDDLVNPAILKEYANAKARITWVGKRGGCQSTPQAFIERLMVREALAGETVVRLKGGDPMVFGRAGEEIAALQKAAIAFEVISGITSAVAASASIQASLTHREYSHGVLFATAHPKKDGQDLDWVTILNCGISIVLYMGTQRARFIQEQAIESNLPGNLPVCVVQNASCANEKRLQSQLDRFSQDMQSQGIGSPAVLMIGRAFESVRIMDVHPILSKATNARIPSYAGRTI
jgi:uroporphyrin-III C-methyltransferase